MKGSVQEFGNERGERGIATGGGGEAVLGVPELVGMSKISIQPYRRRNNDRRVSNLSCRCDLLLRNGFMRRHECSSRLCWAVAQSLIPIPPT